VILLARHGETDDNRDPIRIQGHTDTPLNDTGREQAAELAERVAGEGIASLYTSGLSRAAETAAIVGRRLWRDVARENPELYAAWRAAGDRFRFPGGESLREHQERTLAAIADVQAANELPALLVCHGGTIRVALCHTHERGLDAFHDWDVPNVALVRL